jgi:hypothetical protein
MWRCQLERPVKFQSNNTVTAEEYDEIQVPASAIPGIRPQLGEGATEEMMLSEIKRLDSVRDHVLKCKLL